MISEIKSTVNNYETGSPIPSIHTEEFDLLLNEIAADNYVREDDFVSLPMKDSTTNKWIILPATSNQAVDLTGAITVSSIQRYYDAVTIIKTAKETTGVAETERTTSPPRSGSTTCTCAR